MTSDYRQLISDFKTGLIEGEKVVEDLLLKKFGAVTKNVGKDKLGWDLEVIKIDGAYIGVDENTFDEKKLLEKFVKKYGRTFEVKRDVTSDKTGNFFWECWSNKRVNNPGCMLTCTADTIVFVRKSEIVFLNRPMLLSWLFENLYTQSELYESWVKKTSKGAKTKVMMSAHNNADVRGIIVPVEHMKSSIACFLTEKRVADK